MIPYLTLCNNLSRDVSVFEQHTSAVSIIKSGLGVSKFSIYPTFPSAPLANENSTGSITIMLRFFPFLVMSCPLHLMRPIYTIMHVHTINRNTYSHSMESHYLSVGDLLKAYSLNSNTFTRFPLYIPPSISKSLLSYHGVDAPLQCRYSKGRRQERLISVHRIEGCCNWAY